MFDKKEDLEENLEEDRELPPIDPAALKFVSSMMKMGVIMTICLTVLMLALFAMIYLFTK